MKKLLLPSKTKNKRKRFFNKESSKGGIVIAMMLIPFACIMVLIGYGIRTYLFITLMLLIPTIAFIIYSDKQYG